MFWLIGFFFFFKFPFQLDDWVLCRIYKKRNMGKVVEPKVEDSSPHNMVDHMIRGVNYEANNNILDEQQQMLKFPRTFSLAHLLELDYLGPISHLLNDNNNNISSYSPAHDFLNSTFPSSGNNGFCQKLEPGEMPYQSSDPVKFQVAQTQNGNFGQQHVFANQGLGYDMYGLDR